MWVIDKLTGTIEFALTDKGLISDRAYKPVKEYLRIDPVTSVTSWREYYALHPSDNITMFAAYSKLRSVDKEMSLTNLINNYRKTSSLDTSDVYQFDMSNHLIYLLKVLKHSPEYKAKTVDGFVDVWGFQTVVNGDSGGVIKHPIECDGLYALTHYDLPSHEDIWTLVDHQWCVDGINDRPKDTFKNFEWCALHVPWPSGIPDSTAPNAFVYMLESCFKLSSKNYKDDVHISIIGSANNISNLRGYIIEVKDTEIEHSMVLDNSEVEIFVLTKYQHVVDVYNKALEYSCHTICYTDESVASL